MKFNYESVSMFCLVNSAMFATVGLISFLFFNQFEIKTFVLITGVFGITRQCLALLRLHYLEKTHKK